MKIYICVSDKDCENDRKLNLTQQEWHYLDQEMEMLLRIVMDARYGIWYSAGNDRNRSICWGVSITAETVNDENSYFNQELKKIGRNYGVTFHVDKVM